MPNKGRTRVWLKAQNINLALDLIALRLNQLFMIMNKGVHRLTKSGYD